MSTDSIIHPCPVCSSPTQMFFSDKFRAYRQCGVCSAVHVPAEHHLSEESEKAEYDKHENNIYDEGYRRFLARMMNPLLDILPAGACGLDFGCGPGPALAAMLEERGFTMSVFDKYYAHDTEAMEVEYDFVCTTEVVEHLQQPFTVIEQLWKLIKPRGVLGVMTKRVQDLEKFKGWHYKNDPTHIVFFHENTFAWIAKKLGADLRIISSDVVLLLKPDATILP